jgi:glycosyltransferase involved in cell wall biosynthesis
MQNKILSVIIPCYNEEDTILLILEKLNSIHLKYDISKEILIIDDFSLDNSKNIIQNFIQKNQNFNIKYIRNEKNYGKGYSIRKGIEICNGDYIIIQDADLEYNPEMYDKLIEPIVKNNADVVYGSRFIGGEPHRILFFWHSIGNKFLTFTSNMFTNLNLTDMETCYKLFKSDIIKKIKLKENRFGFEPEITAKIAKIKSLKIYEVGISYYGRTYNEGKKINWKDGFRALYCIIKYSFVN